MKKIIPFKKDIIFKSNLSEIVSISLEHTLQTEIDNIISGKFIVSGEYKLTDTSVNTEAFSYDLPFSINIDERFILDKVFIDIDDFYYEIVNDNVLAINIEVLIDKIEEKELEKPIVEKRIEAVVEPVVEIEEERCMEEETLSLFDNLDNSLEQYKSYTIYIIREGDNVETIIQKYSITKEVLESYNNLEEIKIGDKIIIPC